MSKIQDFVKRNVLLATNNKKGKQVFVFNQLPYQATANPRNQGASSSLTHKVNHVHIDDEEVETTLAMSSLQNGESNLGACKIGALTSASLMS